MSTFVVIGAGPGLGLAAARRFAQEGLAVALVARSRERVDELASVLVGEGFVAQGFVADAGSPSSLVPALSEAERELGPIEAVQYSPAPAASFMKDVLDTSVADLDGPVRVALHGPVTVAQHLLPTWRSRGSGTLLFVNGGSAMTPRAAVAGTSIAYAAESAYAAMLHETLAGSGIHVGQLIVPGAIVAGDPHKDPAVLADRLWAMHRDRGAFRVVVGAD